MNGTNIYIYILAHLYIILHLELNIFLEVTDNAIFMLKMVFILRSQRLKSLLSMKSIYRASQKNYNDLMKLQPTCKSLEYMELS